MTFGYNVSLLAPLLVSVNTTTMATVIIYGSMRDQSFTVGIPQQQYFFIWKGWSLVAPVITVYAGCVIASTVGPNSALVKVNPGRSCPLGW